MSKILIVNPRRKKKGKKTIGRKPPYGGRKPPKKRKRKNPGGKPSINLKGAVMAKKKKRRKNPSTRTAAKVVAKRTGRRMIAGMNPKRAAMDALIGQPGMLMAQFFAKRFGGDGKSFFDDDWSWENFAWAVGGSFAAGLAGNLIMPGKGQKMLEHGLALTLNKLVQDKVIQQNRTLKAALGNYGAMAAKYQGAARLNPTAAASMRQFDMYGNPTVAGPIVPESATMGRVNPYIRPAGDLGRVPTGPRMTPRTDLGGIAESYQSAFIKN